MKKNITMVRCISDYSEDRICCFIRGNYYKMKEHNDDRYYDVEIIDNNGGACEFMKTSLFATSIFLRHFEISLKETRKEKLKKLYKL